MRGLKSRYPWQHPSELTVDNKICRILVRPLVDLSYEIEPQILRRLFPAMLARNANKCVRATRQGEDSSGLFYNLYTWFPRTE